MKYFFMIFSKLVFFISSEAKDNKFFPNLPAGEYRVYFKAAIQCNANAVNSQMQHNFYLSKISSNSSELRGNITYKIPFDDTLKLHINLAIKDSIGGWKDNAHVFESPKACTTYKTLCGIEWIPFLKSFGIDDYNCPIAPGTYVSKGYDLTNALSRTGFPKVFFYGTYKARVYFTDKFRNEYGCVSYIIEVKRPWEID